MKYELIDSGDGKKLEDFGPYRLIRPCGHAFWPISHPKEWETIHATFSREGKKHWTGNFPETWNIEMLDLKFKISPTDFGHLGIFPEHEQAWKWIQHMNLENSKVLNLFAYSGGASLMAAKQGAQVCHLDASPGMVKWARDNAKLNELEKAPIRWIVDDVMKFLKREIKRESLYEGLIVDPPSFGRGNKGEVFKIEEEIIPLLMHCRKVLSKKPKFVFFSCHTPSFSPKVMHHLLELMMKGKGGHIESGEMLIPSKKSRELPMGCYARWSP